MIEYTASAYILAACREGMKTEDREQADIERAFWASSGAYDANERAAYGHLRAIREIGQ